jgi:hypothetical protein
LNGIIQALARQEPANSALVYGADISPGYFALFGYLLRELAPSMHAIPGIQNLITFAFSLLSLLPLGYLVSIIGGRRAACAAIVLVVSVPVWWLGSLYGHPMWPALFFVLTGLSVAALEMGSVSRKWSLDLLVVVLLAIGMSCRLDAILMTPMLLGFCSRNGTLHWGSVLRAGGYVLSAAGLTLLFRAGWLPSDRGVSELGTATSIVDLLIRFHDPKTVPDALKSFAQTVLRAVSPFLAISFVCSIAHALVKRRYDWLWLVVPTVAINCLFWLPNSKPFGDERHFIWMVPAVVTSIAAMAGTLWTGASCPRSTKIIVAGALGLLAASVLVQPVLGSMPVHLAHAILAMTLVGSCFETLGLLRPKAMVTAVFCLSILVLYNRQHTMLNANGYSRNEAMRLTQLAAPLLSLPPQNALVYVVGDAHPIVAAMQMQSRSPLLVRLITERRELSVRTEQNEFRFYIAGWDRDRAIRAVEEVSQQVRLHLVVDEVVARGLNERISRRDNILKSTSL